MTTNWRTSLAGLAAAILTAIAASQSPNPLTDRNIWMGAAVATIGVLAKDGEKKQ